MKVHHQDSRTPSITTQRHEDAKKIKRSRTTLTEAPLVSGDPSAPLGVTGFEGSFGAFEACHPDQASVSERAERSPECTCAVEP
jgi:hypothetical protein